MKAFNNFTDAAVSRVGYETPEMEVVEISVERGFEASDEVGFEGPPYGEEDIEW